MKWLNTTYYFQKYSTDMPLEWSVSIIVYIFVRLYAFVYSYVHMSFSKLKKLIRYIRSKQGAFQEEERQKKLTRYETDHFLEPFGGLTPEYMEMSQYYTLNILHHFGS